MGIRRMLSWVDEPGRPIETAMGLREAVLDVVLDEMNGRFTVEWLCNRLPYGQRVRDVVRHGVKWGLFRRVRYGVYEVV